MVSVADAIMWPVSGAACAALLAAAWRDVASRLIPNGLSGVALLCGIGLRFAAGELVPGLVAGFSVFAFALALWWFRLLGGGDVKLLAAAAVLVPSGQVVTLLLTTAIAGGVLSSVYLLLRPVVRRSSPGRRPAGRFARILRVEAWRIRRGGPLPYGVAIVAASLFVLAGG